MVGVSRGPGNLQAVVNGAWIGTHWKTGQELVLGRGTFVWSHYNTQYYIARLIEVVSKDLRCFLKDWR